MRVKKLLGFSRIYSDEFGFGTRIGVHGNEKITQFYSVLVRFGQV